MLPCVLQLVLVCVFFLSGSGLQVDPLPPCTHIFARTHPVLQKVRPYWVGGGREARVLFGVRRESGGKRDGCEEPIVDGIVVTSAAVMVD